MEILFTCVLPPTLALFSACALAWTEANESNNILHVIICLMETSRGLHGLDLERIVS